MCELQRRWSQDVLLVACLIVTIYQVVSDEAAAQVPRAHMLLSLALMA